jgi:hypothetical protein
MATLTVKTDNKTNAKKLAGFLKTIGYVKEVHVGELSDNLTDDDWVLPGRPATEAEIDKLLTDMDKDGDTGITTAKLRKKTAQWNKGIYK